MTDPVMRALAYLSRVVEPPCPLLAALMARVGPVEAADRVKRRAIDDQLLRVTEARHEIDCATRDLGILARLGGRLVNAADTESPLLAFTAFAGVDTKQRPEAHPPLVLWVTGPARLDEVAERAAAIVGTRAATAYGEHVAAEQRDTVDVLVEMLVKLPSKGWLVSGVNIVGDDRTEQLTCVVAATASHDMRCVCWFLSALVDETRCCRKADPARAARDHGGFPSQERHVERPYL